MQVSRLPQDIYRSIVEWCDCGRVFTLATVVKAGGSTPCKAGAKAMIDAGGAIFGTIGGGLVEAEAQRLAIAAMANRRPLVFDFNLEGEAVADSDPICGGTMRVLIDPTAGRQRAEFSAAADARQNRRRGVLLTAIRGTVEPEIVIRFLAEESIAAEIGFPGAEIVCNLLRKEESGLFIAESPPDLPRLEIFVDPLIPNPMLLIAGGGHIGQALALQASLVGFDITVIEDRPEFANPDLFPAGAIVRCCPLDEEIENLPVDENTYLVIVTRGHQHDAAILATWLHKPAAYLGMIGSRRKVELMRKEFIASGRATAAAFDRVQSPIGLDIGAATVPEIAASIVAQLIAVRRHAASPKITCK